MVSKAIGKPVPRQPPERATGSKWSDIPDPMLAGMVSKAIGKPVPRQPSERAIPRALTARVRTPGTGDLKGRTGSVSAQGAAYVALSFLVRGGVGGGLQLEFKI